MPNPSLDDDKLPRHHSQARAPFPVSPLLIVVSGILFFLLILSGGFNVWILTNPDHPLRDAQEMRLRAERELQQQVMVQQAAQTRTMQQEFQQKLAAAQRKNDELASQNEALKEQLDEAKDGKADQPQEQAAQPGWGTLQGRVVFDGEMPKIESYEEAIRKHPDAKFLLPAPKEMLLDPTWRIDETTKGVANVCVFIKRPANGKLPIHRADKIRKDKVIIDTKCAYVPYMAAHYPEWFDGKERGKTGQVFAIRYPSDFRDNHFVTGEKFTEPGRVSFTEPGQDRKYQLNPEIKPLNIASSIHSWMRGKVWVFDHPYFAITKADGTFSIPRVPAGMEVQVMAWHESQGWLFTKDGKTMTLEDGKNVLDFAIKAP